MFRFRTILLVAFVTLLITSIAPTITAQTAIFYGQSFVVDVTPDTQTTTYIFNGNTGDQVTIRALGLLPNLVPQISLTSPSGTATTSEPSAPNFVATAVQLTSRLRENGEHTLTLSTPANSSGQVMVSITQRTPQNAEALEPGQGVSVALTNEPPALYLFYSDATTERTLCINPESTDVDFAVTIYDPSGRVAATLQHAFSVITYAIPAEAPRDNSAFYEVELRAAQPDTTGNVIVGLDTCQPSPSEAPPAQPTPPPPPPATAPPQPTAPPPTETPTMAPDQVATLAASPTMAPDQIAPTETPITCTDTDPDSDGDGVCDMLDDCPGNPGLPEYNGCNDPDGDGIPDGTDFCPLVPGPPEDMGCPDTDGDGVHDGLDGCVDMPGDPPTGCPTTGSPDQGTLVYTAEPTECLSEDTDGDGICDLLDDCPGNPGLPEYNGCADPDGDGIPDGTDFCPLVPGPADADGCPDTDGDGVHDGLDGCVDMPGVPPTGCPATATP